MPTRSTASVAYVVRAAALSAALAIVAACAGGSARGTLASEPAQRLADLQRAPDSTGVRIYEGSVFPLDTLRTVPLFRYDRRVRKSGSRLVSTHLTRDLRGDVVVAQIAEHDSAYHLRRASMIHKQNGLSASVEVVHDTARFARTLNGKRAQRAEVLDAPLVAGPTMFGFIVGHWSALRAGRRVPVRFAVLERNESIAFVLDTIAAPRGRVTVRMRPRSPIVRLMVGPTYFYFDAQSRMVQGYDGRVPPMEEVNDRLKTLDARVTYAYKVAHFQ